MSGRAFIGKINNWVKIRLFFQTVYFSFESYYAGKMIIYFFLKKLSKGLDIGAVKNLFVLKVALLGQFFLGISLIGQIAIWTDYRKIRAD